MRSVFFRISRSMRRRSFSRRRRAFSAAKSAPACEIAACVLERRGDLACPPSSLFHQARSIEAVIDPRRRTIGRRAIATSDSRFSTPARCSHDRTSDVVLDSKHVLRVAVEPLRPVAETVGDLRGRSGSGQHRATSVDRRPPIISRMRHQWNAETCSELSMGPLI
jgi:hypothetical protein